MPDAPKPLTFQVSARRLDAHASQARCKQAELAIDTDLTGNPAAFNPAELLLAALAGCMIKGIERVAPILKFQLRGVEVRLHGVRQDRRRHAWPASVTRSSSIRMSRTGGWHCCTTMCASTARCSTRWRRARTSAASCGGHEWAGTGVPATGAGGPQAESPAAAAAAWWPRPRG